MTITGVVISSVLSFCQITKCIIVVRHATVYLLRSEPIKKPLNGRRNKALPPAPCGVGAGWAWGVGHPLTTAAMRPVSVQDEREQLKEFGTHLEGLNRRAKNVVQLKPRNPATPLKGKLPIQAVCDFKQLEVRPPADRRTDGRMDGWAD